MCMYDSEQIRSLAKRPEYGKNDLTEDTNPLDLSKGVAGDVMKDRAQQIDNQPDVDTEKDYD